jgi:hypothetical protein
MNTEHKKILQRIKSQEENKTEEPTEQATLSYQLSSTMEICNDYVEDPLG